VLASGHPHRQRVLLKQQPERSLAAFQVGDIDTDADAAAVRRPSLLDPGPSVSRQLLLVIALRQGMAGHAFPEPFLLPPNGIGILAMRQAGAKNVFEAGALNDGRRIGSIEPGVLPVPQHQPIVLVEYRQSFGDDVQRFRQVGVRGEGPFSLFGKPGLSVDQPDEIAEIRVDHPHEQNQQQAEIDADADQKRFTGSEQAQRERQPRNEQCQAGRRREAAEAIGGADAAHEDEKRDRRAKRGVHGFDQRQGPDEKTGRQSRGKNPHPCQKPMGLFRREFDAAHPDPLDHASDADGQKRARQRKSQPPIDG
jgi:hypothetical protein